MRKVTHSYNVETWFLEGINFKDVPGSMDELRERFPVLNCSSSVLSATAKWEPLLRGHTQAHYDGWVPLSDLAKTRRGIATGANDFFLISPSKARQKGIRPEMLLPCVGRANDVPGRTFTSADFSALKNSDAKCLLLNMTGSPSEAERAYISEGEADKLTDRFILANRRPWFSMEQRPPAAIWAAVFGRDDLGFVHNEAGVRSLTNFHCVYPINTGTTYAKALTAALNSEIVRNGARGHVRGYGGGLMKFEPNDLKAILVPAIDRARPETIEFLAQLLSELDIARRQGGPSKSLLAKLDETVEAAGNEASSSPGRLL